MHRRGPIFIRVALVASSFILLRKIVRVVGFPLLEVPIFLRWLQNIVSADLESKLITVPLLFSLGVIVIVYSSRSEVYTGFVAEIETTACPRLKRGYFEEATHFFHGDFGPDKFVRSLRVWLRLIAEQVKED